MLWLVLAAGGMGVLFGFWLLRVHLVVAASVALILVCIVAALLARWPALGSVAFIVAAVGALQFGYLAGVLTSLVRTRERAPHAIWKSSHIDQ